MIDSQFIQVKTKANFESELSSGNIKDTSIAFIEDTDQIWAKGKYYSVIPKEGHERQILSWKASGEAKWEDLSNMFTGLEEVLAYGVQWDTTVSDPHLTRIGNTSLHKTLPIQSQLKGCIAQADKVIYWLNEDDWRWRKNPIMQEVTLAISDTVYTLTSDIFSTKQYERQWVKINNIACQIDSVSTETNTATLVSNDELVDIEAGTITIELGSVRNGYDGTVRVYCPNFYIKSYIEGNIRKVYISTVKIDNSWTYQHEILVDAYRCTVLRQVPENMGYLSTLPQNSAVSIANHNTYCRGGNNIASLDQYYDSCQFHSLLGKPATQINRANMRTYSRNANSEMLSYEQYKNIFYWLWVIEYANFYSQETFNEELTSDGYRQGGMGNGITNLNNEQEWIPLSSNNPVTPCGFGDEYGNRTTEIVTEQIDNLQIRSNNGWIHNWGKINCTNTTNSAEHSITITNITNPNARILYRYPYYTIGTFIFNVTGLQEGQQLEVRYANSGTIYTITQDGNHTITFENINEERQFVPNFSGECNIKIVQNALPENQIINFSLRSLRIPRWRGFDNPFGDIFTNLDGVLIDTPLAGANDESILPNCYIITDPEKYTDSLDGIEEKADRIVQQCHTSGYIKEFNLGSNADIVPTELGGNTVTYKCDYYYVNYDETPETLFVGGYATHGGYAGLGAFYSIYTVSTALAYLGFRSVSSFVSFSS